MKIVFFHVSDKHRIEKFDPKNNYNHPNFFWVDDRYHNHISYTYPKKFIHLFISDPWKEYKSFTFMQGIGYITPREWHSGSVIKSSATSGVAEVVVKSYKARRVLY